MGDSGTKAQRPRTQKRSVTFPADLLLNLDKLAAKQGTDTSKLIRKYVEQGLTVDATADDIDFIRIQIHDEVKAVMQPQIERLVKLLVKIGKVSAAGYYTTVHLLDKMMAPGYDDTFREICAKSTRIGIDYMKLKDYSIDDYLQDIDKVLADAERMDPNPKSTFDEE